MKPYIDPFEVAAQRKRARNAVMAAIASGLLARPTTCSRCGEKETVRVGGFMASGERQMNKIQAHHDDYNKPLEVQWLCSKCHSLADRERRLQNEELPLGVCFAAFLLVQGGVQLPFRYDPPHDAGINGDCINRAIRSLRFAGYKRGLVCPMVTAGLSCGHEELMCASQLAELPTYVICHPCSDAQRQKRWERAERRRARRSAKAIDRPKDWGAAW